MSRGASARRALATAESFDAVGAAAAPVGVVVNPRGRAAVPAALWERTVAALCDGGVCCQAIETHPDDANADRVARLIEDLRPGTVVAAGGDGTLTAVVQGLMRARVDTRPALAILPLGTANNVARSLGLRSYRHEGEAALDLAVATARGGEGQWLDLGYVQVDAGGGAYFIGSFAIGMDAQILRTRNQLRRHFRLGPRTGGYPLYLLSCALCLLIHRRAAAQVGADAVAVAEPLYNCLVLNTPLYAGEFRFDAAANVADGCLDLHVFRGPMDYVRTFVGAWRRHLHHTAGRPVRIPQRVQRVREVDVELTTPVAAQLDGEECTPSARYSIRVVPRTLLVRTPAALTPPAAGSSR